MTGPDEQPTIREKGITISHPRALCPLIKRVHDRRTQILAGESGADLVFFEFAFYTMIESLQSCKYFMEPPMSMLVRYGGLGACRKGCPDKRNRSRTGQYDSMLLTQVFPRRKR